MPAETPGTNNPDSRAEEYADEFGYDKPPELAPCRQCERMIPVDMQTCPECDFNYGNTIVGTGFALGMIGGLLTLLIITAIIGIPMVLLAILLITYGILTAKPAADIEGEGGGASKPWYLKSFPQLWREWRNKEA